MGDEALMRVLVTTLIEDTARQVPRLESAVAARDGEACARLAHYSKGACASVGAEGAAEELIRIEHLARRSDFDECRKSLAMLAAHLDRLREAGRSLTGGEQGADGIQA